MPSKAALARTYNLLELPEQLHQVAGPFVGGLVCITRRGRPWRIDTVTAVTPRTITTDSGFTYAAATGEPLFETKKHALEPLTQANLAYLLLAEGLRVAEKLKVNALTPAERAELLPAATLLVKVYQDLQRSSKTRLRERD